MHCLLWQKLQVRVVVNVSLNKAEINCWRTDNECAYTHKMYSDVTEQTRGFIAGTGNCKCHISFTVTGINVNMMAETRWYY